MSLFAHLKKGLSKTTQAFTEKISEVVLRRKVVDEELFDELEEALIQADVGVETSLRLVDTMRRRCKENKIEDAKQLQKLLMDEMTSVFTNSDPTLHIAKGELNVILLVGVNGVGKTTSLGKLCFILKEKGYKVVAAAGDTFRAAAIDQLKIWCQRAGIDLIHHTEGSDPAAVVYDALQAAKARGADILLVDTAGRLQTKKNLMEELKKIKRVIAREVPGAPQEVLLVLDATTGQNALSQASLFSEAVDVSGVILTKLDGTAKGGVILGIQNQFQLPVKYIGIGEKVEDLREFDPHAFSKAFFGEKEE